MGSGALQEAPKAPNRRFSGWRGWIAHGGEASRCAWRTNVSLFGRVRLRVRPAPPRLLLHDCLDPEVIRPDRHDNDHSEEEDDVERLVTVEQKDEGRDQQSSVRPEMDAHSSQIVSALLLIGHVSPFVSHWIGISQIGK